MQPSCMRSGTISGPNRSNGAISMPAGSTSCLAARSCRPDAATRFGEDECLRGGLGQIEAKYLLPLALAHAGRLGKYGA